MCVSRFAHCVKLMGRDMIGQLHGSVRCAERRLQTWLNTLRQRRRPGHGRWNRRRATRCRTPVSRCSERRGKAGVYNCIVHLKPHHQLDEIGASFRLVTEFGPRHAAA